MIVFPYISSLVWCNIDEWTSSDLFYFEKNFQRQTWPPVQHLIPWLCLSRDWSTHETHETHETLTRPLQWKHHSRASLSWSRFSIDWLPACIVERKIIPETQLAVKWRTCFPIADSMAVLGGRARIFRRTGEKKGNSRGVPLLTSKHGN